MIITNENQLVEIYDLPKQRTLDKEISELDVHCKNLIALSPFMILGTTSKSGSIDASPRGGKPGFVKIVDSKQLVLADSKGNNRLDSIKNIVNTGQVGCLFLLPGMDETLRVNGTAVITTSSDLISLFSEEQNQPKTCILIQVETAFMHCAKALMRSKLWLEDYKIDRDSFPSMGQILKDHIKHEDEPETRSDMLKRYQSDL